MHSALCVYRFGLRVRRGWGRQGGLLNGAKLERVVRKVLLTPEMGVGGLRVDLAPTIRQVSCKRGGG